MVVPEWTLNSSSPGLFWESTASRLEEVSHEVPLMNVHWRCKRGIIFRYGCSLETLCCCYSKSIVVTHIKRLCRFDDLLILAAKNAGQNVSAAFWPRRCHTMPPQGNVMGGQVWPQWKSFSCHVSHFHCRGNMFSVCVSDHSIISVMEPLLHHTGMKQKAVITSSLGIVTTLP